MLIVSGKQVHVNGVPVQLVDTESRLVVLDGGEWFSLRDDDVVEVYEHGRLLFSLVHDEKNGWIRRFEYREETDTYYRRGVG